MRAWKRPTWSFASARVSKCSNTTSVCGLREANRFASASLTFNGPPKTAKHILKSTLIVTMSFAASSHISPFRFSTTLSKATHFSLFALLSAQTSSTPLKSASYLNRRTISRRNISDIRVTTIRKSSSIIIAGLVRVSKTSERILLWKPVKTIKLNKIILNVIRFFYCCLWFNKIFIFLINIIFCI